MFNGPTGAYFHLTPSFQYRNLNAIGNLFFTCGLYDLGMEIASVLDLEFMFRATEKLQSVLDSGSVQVEGTSGEVRGNDVHGWAFLDMVRRRTSTTYFEVIRRRVGRC